MDFRTLKAHASRHVMAMLAIGILLPANASAQEAAVFTPASPWTVGSTELSNVRGLSGVKMPCVVSTEFDNGFVVRFSGGGGKMLAMAVDFRQAVFTKGKKYDAAISIGDGYVKQVSASAFTDSTLIFNLRPLIDFYGTLKGGKTLSIDIDDNALKFNLGQIASSYDALENCYSGGKAAPVKPLPGAPTGSPVPLVKAEPVQSAATAPTAMPEGVADKKMPQSLDDIVQGSASDNGSAPAPAAAQKSRMNVAQVTPRPEETKNEIPGAKGQLPKADDSVTTPREVSRPVADDMTSTPRPSADSAPVMPMPISRADNTPAMANAAPAAPMQVAQKPVSMTWEARAGEDIKIVLSRWAERAGYDLQWEAAQDGKVAQDIDLTGSFEDAVTQLLAENSAATGGIAGHIQTEQGATKPLPKKDVAPPPPSSAPVQATIPAMQSEWAAPQGANIQTVLEDWATKAGVTVVWQDYMTIPVKGAVNVNGSFEKAVETLLDQYGADQARPIAQLNIDPSSGQRTLLMSLEK